MTEFETGAVRDTGGKGRMDLLPMCALLRVSKHMEDALTHYPERNWEIGLPMHTMIDSAMRHLVKYADGWTDEDHLCAAATNLLMAMWTEEKKPEMQDIPSRSHEEASSLPAPESDDVPPVSDKEKQRRPYGARRRAYDDDDRECYCYDEIHRCCWGTREKEECRCGGDRSKCDFYEEVREDAKQRQKA